MKKLWTGYVDKNGTPICVGDHVKTKFDVISLIGSDTIDSSGDIYYGLINEHPKPNEIPCIVTFHHNPGLAETLEIIKEVN